MRILTDPLLIDEILTRSVETIFPGKEALRERLLSGEQLRVYMGIDPTADYIHIGHSTNYIILKRLHHLGHKITVLVGDFTAMIGDPSDKTSLRQPLTRAEVEENLVSFKAQISKILDFTTKDNPIEFKFNSDWLSKLSFADTAELAANFTVQQMIERDAFQKRLAANKPLFVHEFLYPLMQGYDSVALDADLEIGGSDQLFNMMAGRTLQKRYNNKDKFVMTTTLLTNPATGEKLMSKSLGTGVSLKAEPNDMFGKVMALADEGIVQCFIDCTNISMKDIDKIEASLKDGVNPRDIKLRLAHEIVSFYHGAEAAEKAKIAWIEQFSNRATPADIKELSVNNSIKDWPSLLILGNFTDTKSEAKRLIKHGAVKLNDEKIDIEKSLEFEDKDILRVGKRGVIRLRK